jgi:hypothetical protein
MVCFEVGRASKLAKVVCFFFSKKKAVLSLAHFAYIVGRAFKPTSFTPLL